MTRINITREHLGDMATDQDVQEFKDWAAIIAPAFASSTAFNPTAQEMASDWLFGNGDYLRRLDAWPEFDSRYEVGTHNETWAYLADEPGEGRELGGKIEYARADDDQMVLTIRSDFTGHRWVLTMDRATGKAIDAELLTDDA